MNHKMKHNVGMISLGCEKNRVDAEIILASVKGRYNIVSDLNSAEAVIVNTCGFIKSAKEESIDEILNLAKLKNQSSSKLKYIVATGCLAERYKLKLLQEIPDLDGVVGIGSNSKIPQILDEVFADNKVTKFGNKCDIPLEGDRVLTTPKYYAYLKIAEGCNNGCAYCAIPMIRGRYRSRGTEDILKEAELLVKNGAKEIIVIAQDITRYGQDLHPKTNLASLLKKLAKIPDLQWIRLLYCYPEKITDELLEVIAYEEKILKYMDIPLQHCSESVLKNMNRQGNEESLSNLVLKIRKRIPNITIRTTFLCGFPGESRRDFAKLCKFVKKMQFDKVGCFAYSREENTKAFYMPNQIKSKVKQQRCKTLMQIQEKVNKSNLKKFITKNKGEYIKVLVLQFDEITGYYIGRSERDAPQVDGKVLFRVKNPDLKVAEGDFVFVRIIGFWGYNLIGVID